jgi:DNA modification methylase
MHTAKVIIGDNRKTLKTLPDRSVQCVVTSPPYWGLRDYGTGVWIGGDEGCSHKRENKVGESTISYHANTDMGAVGDAIYKDVCPRCGARREDDQIGLELTPADYVEQLCQVFDEVWRVLADDGTLWLNLGDSYVGTGSKGDLTDPKYAEGRNGQKVAVNNKVAGLKPKDLVGIPWRVAFALQDRGWYLRSDIIWHKPNPMPESVTDRPTKSHEYIFLLTKSPRYYYDHEAIKEPVAQDWGTRDRSNGKYHNEGTGLQPHSGLEKSYENRNKRDVWTVATKPYAGAHFATYPMKLIEPCILAGSREGDTILDPFSGSGTTGIVALLNGRDYIGTELNPDYAAISKKRITDEVGFFGNVEVING